MMDYQEESSSISPIILTLEIVPADPNDADPALVDAIGRDATEALSQDGARVEPVYTGQKGGFLVMVTMVATFLWTNKEVIIADLSGLVTLLTSGVLPLMKKLQEAYEKRVGKGIAAQYPITFTLEIDEKPFQIEVTNLESAEGVLKLAQHIQANHLSVNTKPQSSKLTTRVPKKPERKRR